MDNKSNIYKSKPEFIKEGFDPFSVQVLKAEPLSTQPLLQWRAPEGGEAYGDKFAVDANGKLVLFHKSEDVNDYILSETGTSTKQYFMNRRSNVGYPDLEQWGTSSNNGEFTKNQESYTITFLDETYEIINGESFEPELPDYQEGDPGSGGGTIDDQQTDDGFAKKMFFREFVPDVAGEESIYLLVDNQGRVLMSSEPNENGHQYIVCTPVYIVDDLMVAIESVKNYWEGENDRYNVAEEAISEWGSNTTDNPVVPSGADMYPGSREHSNFTHGSVTVDGETVAIDNMCPDKLIALFDENAAA